MIPDFVQKEVVVIDLLIREDGYKRSDAIRAWYNSKTRQHIIKRALKTMSGTQYHWELLLELENSPRWMKDESLY